MNPKIIGSIFTLCHRVPHRKRVAFDRHFNSGFQWLAPLHLTPVGDHALRSANALHTLTLGTLLKARRRIQPSVEQTQIVIDARQFAIKGLGPCRITRQRGAVSGSLRDFQAHLRPDSHHFAPNL